MIIVILTKICSEHILMISTLQMTVYTRDFLVQYMRMITFQFPDSSERSDVREGLFTRDDACTQRVHFIV